MPTSVVKVTTTTNKINIVLNYFVLCRRFKLANKFVNIYVPKITDCKNSNEQEDRKIT